MGVGVGVGVGRLAGNGAMEGSTDEATGDRRSERVGGDEQLPMVMSAVTGEFRFTAMAGDDR